MNHLTNNQKIIIGSLLIAIAICFGVGLVITLLSMTQGEPIQTEKKSILGVVPYIAPTMTPAPTETPILPTAEVIDGIKVGSVVQIFGTEGVGLKLRADASIQAAQQFVAMDSEIFEITGGPIQADGYVWWQLSSPYDQARSGWAVSDYLTSIQ